jgi:hypothetical protein
MDAALDAARKTGRQRPFRFSLPAAVWRAVVAENDAGPAFLAAPAARSAASAEYRGVPVYYAPRGRQPWLWVITRDGQLGALLATPVNPAEG